jgi:hypothetical protein
VSEGGAGEASERELPEPTLVVHVFHLAAQVGIALGETENPVTGTRETDLRAARFLIDTLAMIEVKTRGNRSPEEDEYLSGVLANLRMAFVRKGG